MFQNLTPAAIAAWAKEHNTAGQAPLLIDVREPWEWQTAKLPTSSDYEMVLLSMGNIPSELSRLDPDRPTALLCHHGMRSMNVAQFLLNQGFSHVVNVQGGIDAWSQTVDSSVPLY